MSAGIAACLMAIAVMVGLAVIPLPDPATLLPPTSSVQPKDQKAGEHNPQHKAQR